MSAATAPLDAAKVDVYLTSFALAEFFANIALCPLEATRIRLVSQPTSASRLVGGFGKIPRTEGVGAFYSGFGPILFKQYVPLPSHLSLSLPLRNRLTRRAGCVSAAEPRCVSAALVSRRAFALVSPLYFLLFVSSRAPSCRLRVHAGGIADTPDLCGSTS
ncbi:hypothetical protein C8J57DRAFT_1729297 [Mycena rebaudengoi]|nr:hypothetical protein C8J57DRAFT_1729297 [Mycena rebaudengoi]